MIFTEKQCLTNQIYKIYIEKRKEENNMKKFVLGVYDGDKFKAITAKMDKEKYAPLYSAIKSEYESVMGNSMTNDNKIPYEVYSNIIASLKNEMIMEYMSFDDCEDYLFKYPVEEQKPTKEYVSELCNDIYHKISVLEEKYKNGDVVAMMEVR